MPTNDDRPDAGGEGAGDQGQEDGNPLGLESTASAAAVNLPPLSPGYREAVQRLQSTFAEDYRAFEDTALRLIGCHGETSADAVLAELRSRTGLRRNHHWRAILARVFRYRNPERAASMSIRRGLLDARDEKFWSDLFLQ